MSGYFYFRDGQLVSESSILYDVPEDVTVEEVPEKDYQAFKTGEKVWDGAKLIDPPPPDPPSDYEVAVTKIDVFYQSLLAEAEKDAVAVASKVDTYSDDLGTVTVDVVEK